MITNKPSEEPSINPTDPQQTTTTSFKNTTLTTTTLPPISSLFMDFCPGVGKNIDCSATGDFIYLTDAFYGISSETPAACVYKYDFGKF